MANIYEVSWSKKIDKQLGRLPTAIVIKFFAWVQTVQLAGIHKTRMTPGFHDEPLKGSRYGQRSVRLNRSYRIIYVEHHDNTIEFIEIIEVNKHEY